MSPTFALAPLSAAYGALVRARLALYRAGALGTHRMAVPVISVGNITAGGTGKTPLVEWVARALAREGLKPCVLTRGYGREGGRGRVVVSDGERLLAGARAGGDEPRLLAEKLLGAAAVVSDADRVAAGLWAVRNVGAEVFVLDDGFQHLRLARDLDLVTVDGAAPWGGGHLLPRGRLREPPGGLARADCIVITRAELARDLGAVRDEAKRLSGGRAVVLAARVRTTGMRRLAPAAAGDARGGTEDELENAALRRPVGAFCGVGNPGAFFSHLRNDGQHVVYERAFADHHAYTQSDVDAVTRGAVRGGARALLTTAKDAVKLRDFVFALPVYVVEITFEFDNEDRLLGLVRAAVVRR